MSHLLDSHGEVQDLVVLEVLQRVLFDDCDAHVRVAERFNPVSNAHDELVLLAHTLHILCGITALISALTNRNVFGQTSPIVFSSNQFGLPSSISLRTRQSRVLLACTERLFVDRRQFGVYKHRIRLRRCVPPLLAGVLGVDWVGVVEEYVHT